VVLISNTLKLSSLLAQYLYANNELHLAGIGRFYMKSLGSAGEQSIPDNKKIISAEVSFEQDSTVKEDQNLVAFISAQSGKMKSLAAADLDSYLELSKQFLNIGKPFLIEGIGVLTKNKSGNLDFIPDSSLNEKIKDSSNSNSSQTSSTEDSFTNYEEMLSPKKAKTPASKKLVLWLTIIAGLVLAVWGGFIVYTKTKKPVSTIETNTTLIKPIDTVANNNTVDTTRLPVKENSSAGTYKFVIEKATQTRALTRYAYLKKLGLSIEMETKDSVNFKLFFQLAALPADTTRIKDSLGLMYSKIGMTTIDQ